MLTDDELVDLQIPHGVGGGGFSVSLNANEKNVLCISFGLLYSASTEFAMSIARPSALERIRSDPH